MDADTPKHYSDKIKQEISETLSLNQQGIQQQEQSRNALMVLQTLIGIPQGIDRDALITTLVPIVTQGVVSRRQAESFITEQQFSPEMIQQLQQLVQQNSQEPPMFDQASLSGMNPEDIDQMTASVQEAVTPQGAEMTADMSNYDMAQAMTPTVNTGIDNYTAGLESNEANPMAGLI